MSDCDGKRCTKPLLHSCQCAAQLPVWCELVWHLVEHEIALELVNGTTAQGDSHGRWNLSAFMLRSASDCCGQKFTSRRSVHSVTSGSGRGIC